MYFSGLLEHVHVDFKKIQETFLLLKILVSTIINMGAFKINIRFFLKYHSKTFFENLVNRRCVGIFLVLLIDPFFYFYNYILQPLNSNFD